MANDVLQNDDFYAHISKHAGFHLADISPDHIAELLRKTRIEMNISLYYALSPLKNFDGFDDMEQPRNIHLNAWKIDRSPASICNTIIHSCVHAVNAHHNEYYFGHGDNRLAGKANTAPYWIGALAQTMVSPDEPIIVPLEHDHHERAVIDVRNLFGSHFAQSV